MTPLEMKPEVVEKLQKRQEAIREQEERLKTEKKLLGDEEK